MKVISIIVGIVFFSSIVSADCIKSEGSVLKVVGNISKETFPGPPNYEDISNGDFPETYWFINLDQPICVVGESQTVDRFQLFFKSGSTITLEEKQRFEIGGITFMGISGHHHTDILIEVSSVVGL